MSFAVTGTDRHNPRRSHPTTCMQTSTHTAPRSGRIREGDRKVENLRSLWFLIALLVIVLGGWARVPWACASSIDAATPSAVRAAQHAPQQILAQGELSAEPRQLSVSATLFRGILRLMKQNYVHEIADEQIFPNPVRKLVMTLPPLCAEKVPDTSACTGDAEDCLLNVIDTVASQCHMDADRVCRTLLNIILRDLDPNTCLLDESMLKELTITTSGKFGGVGVMVAPRKGDYVVISPFEGSPAYRAGIKAGDIMMEIDGQPLHDLPLVEVLGKVRGPAGSVMSLTVKSGKSGMVRHVRLRRRTIVIPPVRYAMVTPSVAYVRIVNFQTDTRTEVEKALFRMKMQGSLKGLILDLRDNPGGLLDQAVQVADLFVSSGPITSLRGRNRQLNRNFSARGRAVMGTLPIVVLVNRGSASSSEVLAGALQGKPHVTVMGERSFGKASVQAIYPLGGGNALRLTTAHYYTAEGRDIEGRGLEPDICLNEPDESHSPEAMEPQNPSQLREDPWVKDAVDVILGRIDSKPGPFPSLY
jgi:carboxyl-terminal processing protease